MRIAFITGEFPALSETFIVNHITGLIDRGHAVGVFADRARPGEIIHPDVGKYRLLERIHYWPRMPENGLRRAAKGIGLAIAGCVRNPRMVQVVFRALQSDRRNVHVGRLFILCAAMSLRKVRDYAVIHAQFGPDGIKGMLLRNVGALRGKLLVSFRGHDLSGFLRRYGPRIYDRLFERADLLMPVTERMKHRLTEMGCREDKIVVLRTGLHLDRFPYRTRHGSPADKVRIVSVARLVEKKGLEYGIRAVAKLVAQRRNVEYRIVGDGPLRAELERLIEKLQVQEIVEVTGMKPPPAVAEILENSDIMLAPSVTSADGDQEGLPHAMKEAMATGLPVVATRHAGADELVEDGTSGFLVPERDADALAEKLGYLAGYPERRREMGRKARAFVEEHDDIEKINDRLVEIYAQLAGTKA